MAPAHARWRNRRHARRDLRADAVRRRMDAARLISPSRDWRASTPAAKVRTRDEGDFMRALVFAIAALAACASHPAQAAQLHYTATLNGRQDPTNTGSAATGL